MLSESGCHNCSQLSGYQADAENSWEVWEGAGQLTFLAMCRRVKAIVSQISERWSVRKKILLTRIVIRFAGFIFQELPQ